MRGDEVRGLRVALMSGGYVSLDITATLTEMTPESRAWLHDRINDLFDYADRYTQLMIIRFAEEVPQHG